MSGRGKGGKVSGISLPLTDFVAQPTICLRDSERVVPNVIAKFFVITFRVCRAPSEHLLVLNVP